jgi:pyruvate formate lyase activating enzyme
MKEAMLWEKLGRDRVHCFLCAHHCHINEGKKGICQVRRNRGGVLFSQTYGRIIAEHVDPVEKKPLYHFYPGSSAYSISAPGCNFRCLWCQNWEISQEPREEQLVFGPETPPEDVVADAVRTHCRSIAYTYTEPTMFTEYALDCARLAREAGVANVYVTNGFMTAEMLDAFYPYLDAANVDLKAFRDATYQELIGGKLQPVLDTLLKLKSQGVWVEVTTLIIPGVNDSEAELGDIARFLAENLGPDTPWHVSRFFPTYKLTDVAPTPLDTLRLAEEIGRAAGVRYVYVGNARANGDTLCHACGHLLIRRTGFSVVANEVREGRCPACGAAIAGVGLG